MTAGSGVAQSIARQRLMDKGSCTSRQQYASQGSCSNAPHPIEEVVQLWDMFFSH